MKYLILTVCLSFIGAMSANAAPIVIAEGKSAIPPVVSYVEVDAEYVSIPLTITSNVKHPADKYRLIGNLERLVKDKAKSLPNLMLRENIFSTPSKDNNAHSSELLLLAQIGNSDNIYKSIDSLFSFIYSIQIPDNTELSYGSIKLGLANPEQYRKSLESKIKTEITKTRETMGDNFKVYVDGLSDPVRAMPLGGRKLAVYIPYKIAYSELVFTEIAN